MTGVSTEDLSEVAAELRAALAEHDEVCAALPAAERAYKRALLAAHANSTALFPDRRVKEHEVAAEQGSFNEWAALNELQYRRRALSERLHSLRQVLSAFQTQTRVEAEFVRGAA